MGGAPLATPMDVRPALFEDQGKETSLVWSKSDYSSSFAVQMVSILKQSIHAKIEEKI